MQSGWHIGVGAGAVCGALLWMATLPVAASDPPPTPEQIEAACVKGIAWLVAQQQSDGGWGHMATPEEPWTDIDRVAKTGLAVLKLETRAIELGLQPLDPAYEYADEVQRGLDFIMVYQVPFPIALQPAGNPDSNGNAIGIAFTDWGGHYMYQTGIAMMALAASGAPAVYGSVLQDAQDFLAWAQADCVPHRGGWRYNPDQCSSDNSNSGYVAIGLGYAAAAPPWGFGLPVPGFVKSELSIWIDVMQDDVNGDPDDGGSWYDPGWSWVNILKTGNLLHEMGLVGDTAATPRVKDAIDYIERHWNDPGFGGGTGWTDHRQAMFTLMKGLESLGVTLLDVDGDGVPETDWFAEVANHLLTTQNADGSWPWDPWGDQVLSTSWALLTLEKAVPVFEIKVPVDIKPTSCPNPVNRTSKGVLPVAILGTADFDVTQIDPATVVLSGPTAATVVVPALRWAYEDVATPYEPYVDKPVEARACTTLGPDGFLDLTLKFDEPAVWTLLGSAVKGDVIVLKLTGQLFEEAGGTKIVGEDVVVVVK